MKATQRTQNVPPSNRSSYEEGEIIIFPGFPDNQPTQIIANTVEHGKIKEDAQNTPLSEIEAVRETIQKELNGIAAEYVTDINLEANRHMEFKIKLIETDTRPIRSKSRPIPHSFKDQVRTAIFDQLKAGLIRYSKSEWASLLHIVMKPDGTVRITVDYKRLKYGDRIRPISNAKRLTNVRRIGRLNMVLKV